MSIYVYVTDECLEQATRRGLKNLLMNNKDKIEKNKYLIGFEDINKSKFYKRRLSNNTRIVGYLHKPEGCDYDIFVINHFFQRDDNNYDKLIRDIGLNNNDNYKPKNLELICNKVSERVKTEPIIKPEPTEEEYKWLYEVPAHDSDEENYKNEIYVYETKLWVQNVKNCDYLSDIQNLIYNKLDKEINQQLSLNIEDNSVNYVEDEEKEVRIAYKFFVNSKSLILLTPIFNTNDKDYLEEINKNIHDTSEYINEVFEKDENKERVAARSYPFFILSDRNLWISIQKDGEANIALSSEELELLQQIRKRKIGYPLFINGRAGSGKSTMLHYLFVDYVKHYLKNLNQPNPLFLTYSKHLLDKAQKTVRNILETRWSNIINDDKKIIKDDESFNKCFRTFDDFLYDLLSLETLEQFPPTKHLSVIRFPGQSDKEYKKRLWEALLKNRINYVEFRNKIWEPNLSRINPRLDISLVWHVIRVYIKGMKLDKDTDFDYDDYKELSSTLKTVTDEVFKQVYDNYWKGPYKNLFNERGYWDNQDLVLYLLNLDLEGKLSNAKVPCIFCDEAQDFTSNELSLIIRSLLFSERVLGGEEIKYLPLVFAGDPLQTINPTGFKWENVQKMFYNKIKEILHPKDQTPIQINFRELKYNYRSNKGIVKFNNLIQLLRKKCFDLKNVQPQTCWFDEDQNFVYYAILPEGDKGLEESISNLLKIENRNYIKIINCEESEISELINDDNVLSRIFSKKEIDECSRTAFYKYWTPSSIKGLEFDNVVVYKFGSSPEAKNIYNLLKNKNNVFNPSEQLKNEYFMNRLYVAISRAKSSLIIVDTKDAFDRFWIYAIKPEEQNNFVSENIKDKEWGTSITIMEPWDKRERVANTPPKELAEELKERGLNDNDPNMLFQASFYFTEANCFKEASRCKAQAFELKEDYEKAADLYFQIEEIKEAIDCLWQGKLWANYTKKFAEVYREKVKSDVNYLAAKFMANEFQDINEFIKEFWFKLWDKRTKDKYIKIISNDIIWVDISWKILKEFVVKVNDINISNEDRIKEIIDKLSELGFYNDSDKNDKLALFYFKFKDYRNAVRLWEKYKQVGSKEYFEAKYELENYPQKFYWCAKLKKVDEILEKLSDQKIINTLSKNDKKEEIINEIVDLITERKPDKLIEALHYLNDRLSVETIINHKINERRFLENIPLEDLLNCYVNVIVNNYLWITVKKLLKTYEFEYFDNELNQIIHEYLKSIQNKFNKEQLAITVFEAIAKLDVKRESQTELADFFFNELMYDEDIESMNDSELKFEYYKKLGLAIESFNKHVDNLNYYEPLMYNEKLERNIRKYFAERLADCYDKYGQYLEKENKPAFAKENFDNANNIRVSWGLSNKPNDIKPENSNVQKHLNGLFTSEVLNDKNRCRITNTQEDSYITVFKEEMIIRGEPSIIQKKSIINIDKKKRKIKDEITPDNIDFIEKKESNTKEFSIPDWNMDIKLEKIETLLNVKVYIKGKEIITKTY